MTELLADRHQIEQRLGRVVFLAVAGIEDRNVDPALQLLVVLILPVADHHRIQAEALKRFDRIVEGFALLHRRGLSVEVDYLHAQFFLGGIEAVLGPGGWFKKQVGDDFSFLAVDELALAALFGNIEKMLDLVDGKGAELE